MEYYAAIKKNSFELILMRWMKLEPIIQSEVSQKDKDHYNIPLCFFKNFPQYMIHIVRRFSTVNEAEVDVFLKLHSFFYVTTNATI